MDWLLLAGIVVLLVGTVIQLYRIDRQAERRRTRDALSPQLTAEIERERAATLARKEKFAAALHTAAMQEKNRTPGSA